MQRRWQPRVLLEEACRLFSTPSTNLQLTTLGVLAQLAELHPWAFPRLRWRRERKSLRGSTEDLRHTFKTFFSYTSKGPRIRIVQFHAEYLAKLSAKKVRPSRQLLIEERWPADVPPLLVTCRDTANVSVFGTLGNAHK